MSDLPNNNEVDADHPWPVGVRDPGVWVPRLQSRPSDGGRAARSDEIPRNQRVASRSAAGANV